MRKDVGVDGDAQRISQLVWMFFLKIYDDREQELELLEDDYKSPIPKHLRWRNWAADKEGMTGDELADLDEREIERPERALDERVGRARRHGGDAVCLAAESGGSRFRIDLPRETGRIAWDRVEAVVLGFARERISPPELAAALRERGVERALRGNHLVQRRRRHARPRLHGPEQQVRQGHHRHERNQHRQPVNSAEQRRHLGRNGGFRWFLGFWGGALGARRLRIFHWLRYSLL